MKRASAIIFGVEPMSSSRHSSMCLVRTFETLLLTYGGKGGVKRSTAETLGRVKRSTAGSLGQIERCRFQNRRSTATALDGFQLKSGWRSQRY